jgi:DNA-binding transcriptional regulator YdaS (Cro superfamily)
MDAALREAVRVAGSMRALARMIGTSHQAIAQWDRVPAERVPDVERATGVSRHRLRPDLYPEPSGVGGTRTASSRTIVEDLGELSADLRGRTGAKVDASVTAAPAAARQALRTSVEEDPLHRAAKVQAIADAALAEEDPLRRVTRRTASRAMHSLLTLDPDILSNHNATLLERRIATFLYEELRQAQEERARHEKLRRAFFEEEKP